MLKMKPYLVITFCVFLSIHLVKGDYENVVEKLTGAAKNVTGGLINKTPRSIKDLWYYCVVQTKFEIDVGNSQNMKAEEEKSITSKIYDKFWSGVSSVKEGVKNSYAGRIYANVKGRVKNVKNYIFGGSTEEQENHRKGDDYDKNDKGSEDEDIKKLLVNYLEDTKKKTTNNINSTVSDGWDKIGFSGSITTSDVLKRGLKDYTNAKNNIENDSTGKANDIIGDRKDEVKNATYDIAQNIVNFKVPGKSSILKSHENIQQYIWVLKNVAQKYRKKSEAKHIAQELKRLLDGNQSTLGKFYYSVTATKGFVENEKNKMKDQFEQGNHNVETAVNNVNQGTKHSINEARTNIANVNNNVQDGIKKGQDYIKSTATDLNQNINNSLTFGSSLIKDNEPKTLQSFSNIKDNLSDTRNNVSEKVNTTMDTARSEIRNTVN